MSSKSRGSTLMEIPGLFGALDRLQELGNRMGGDDFGFRGRDIENVDSVIDAIHESHAECDKLHEKLETQTIQASVLRHQLQFYPGIISDEMKAAVTSARQSNSDELERLQTQLTTVNNNIDSLEKSHTTLEKENAVLHPKRDQVRQEHEEIIALLNQRMAEKASKQIRLNETRDKLRETNQKILDLEEGIIQLKEDLIQERAEARMEKKRLKKAVYDTTIKTREQKEVNTIKKKELDGLQEKVHDSEGQLDTIRQSVKKYDQSKEKLEAENKKLSTQLAKELEENEILEERGGILTTQLRDQEEEFATRKENLEKKIKELDSSITEETVRNAELVKTKAQLDIVVEQKMEVRKTDAGRVASQNEVLQKSKKQLAFKAEEVARLTQENADMEQRIEQLGETHEAIYRMLEQTRRPKELRTKDPRADKAPAIMATLSKQIEECREALSKERKERMQLQDEREDVQKGLDDIKHTSHKDMADMNKKINEGKVAHDSLSKEGSELQRALREHETTLVGLQNQYETTKRNYIAEKERREVEIEKLEREMTNLHIAKEEKEKLVVVREPTFANLETDFRQAEIDYDLNKKNLVALKNKKLGLDDAVKRCQKDMDKATAPREAKKKELKKSREESMHQLKTSTEEMRALEKNIFDTGCKLKAAIEENARFDDANSRLNREIDSMTKQMGDSEALLQKLQGEIDGIRGNLQTSWNNDNQMDAIFTMRDEQLVSQLEELLSRTTKREGVIEVIGGKLNIELGKLSEFLHNVEKRRPADEHSGWTPTPTPRPQTSNSSTGNTPMPASVRPPPSSRRHPRPHPSRGNLQPHPPPTVSGRSSTTKQ